MENFCLGKQDAGRKQLLSMGLLSETLSKGLQWPYLYFSDKGQVFDRWATLLKWKTWFLFWLGQSCRRIAQFHIGLIYFSKEFDGKCCFGHTLWQHFFFNQNKLVVKRNYFPNWKNLENIISVIIICAGDNWSFFQHQVTCAILTITNSKALLVLLGEIN